MVTHTPPTYEDLAHIAPDNVGAYEFLPIAENEQNGARAAKDPINYIMCDTKPYGSRERAEGGDNRMRPGYRRCQPGDILRPAGGGYKEVVRDTRPVRREGYKAPRGGWANDSGLMFATPKTLRLVRTARGHPMVEATQRVNGYDIAYDEPDFSTTENYNVYEFSMKYNGQIHIGNNKWQSPLNAYNAVQNGTLPASLSADERRAYYWLADLYEQGCMKPGYTRILEGADGALTARTWDKTMFGERAITYRDRIKYHAPITYDDGTVVLANALSKNIQGKGGDFSLGTSDNLGYHFNTREATFYDPKNPHDHQSNIVRKPVDGEEVLAATPGGRTIYRKIDGGYTTDVSQARPVAYRDATGKVVGTRPDRVVFRASGNRDGTSDALLTDSTTEHYRNRVVGSYLNNILNIITLGAYYIAPRIVGCIQPQTNLDGSASLDGGTGGTTLERQAYNVAIQWNRERRTKDLTGGLKGKKNFSLQAKEVRYAGNAIAASWTDLFIGSIRTIGAFGAIGAGVGAGLLGAPLWAAAVAVGVGVIGPQFLAQWSVTREDRDYETEWHQRANRIAGVTYRDKDGNEVRPGWKEQIVGVFIKNPLRFMGDSMKQAATGLAGVLYSSGGGERGKALQILGTASLAIAGGLLVSSSVIGIPLLAAAAITGTLTFVNLVAGRGVLESYANRYWKGKEYAEQGRAREKDGVDGPAIEM